MSDCSPANRERELGLDRRETGLFYPTDEMDTVTAIEVSTRGTLRSEMWQRRLAERLVLQSYHLLDYG